MKAEIGIDVKRAAKLLRDGGLVAMPTETVYGLAANALNSRAVLSIFEAKKRPGFDPLIVHIGSLEQVAEVAIDYPRKAQKLTEHYWPGPLTIVLKKRDIIPDIVTSGLDTVGVRMPRHPLTLQLLQDVGFPLAAPSANPFGYVSPTTARHVADQLGDRIDYILDGGPCAVGVESTIVSFTEHKPKVLRAGGLSLSEIRRVIGDFDVDDQSTSQPLAPGMLSEHYSPTTPIYLGDIKSLASRFSDKRLVVLGFTSTYGFEGEALSKTGDIREAAKNLFAAMRRLDSGNHDVILSEMVPAEGLGLAINDRLSRASTPLPNGEKMINV